MHMAACGTLQSLYSLRGWIQSLCFAPLVFPACDSRSRARAILLCFALRDGTPLAAMYLLYGAGVSMSVSWRFYITLYHLSY